MTEAKHNQIHTLAQFERGEIKLAFWSHLGHGGLSCHIALSIDEALDLIEQINASIAKQPRVAEAADLGIAA